ncbi:alpha-tocopherol transfer protein-like [Planococcus citri]|uniref:alpha-tocopherol transfer protein-like n=1 Tax=Planococcus citri TaxID=170843 RepID=UPI0031F86CC2
MCSPCFEVSSKNQLYEFFSEFNASTEESVKNDVQYLKEWIRKEAHLPNVEDDEWLTNFLLRCKNSLEKAKTRIDEYYSVRTVMPEFFQGRDQCFDKMEHLLQQCVFVPSLKLTPDGYRVMMYHIFDNNTTFDFHDLMKLALMIFDFGLKMDRIRGMIHILDAQNVTMSIIVYMVSIVRKSAVLSQKTIPIRHHKIYLVNSIPAMNPGIRLYKRFLKKKMGDMIEMWKDDPKNLISVIPKEVLPSIYGGNQGSLEDMRDIWYGEMEKNRDWFISDEANKADFSKKPVDTSHKNKCIIC